MATGLTRSVSPCHRKTVASIKKLGAESGRPIPDDHYGASFAFRLGPADESLVSKAFAARARAAGADFDPEKYFALGKPEAVLERIAQYRAAGVSKFVLIPLAQSEAELLDQTRRLAGEVIPEAHSRA